MVIIHQLSSASLKRDERAIWLARLCFRYFDLWRVFEFPGDFFSLIFVCACVLIIFICMSIYYMWSTTSSPIKKKIVLCWSFVSSLKSYRFYKANTQLNKSIWYETTLPEMERNDKEKTPSITNYYCRLEFDVFFSAGIKWQIISFIDVDTAL